MPDTKNLKKLHIKLPHEIGKPHYISKLPTKKDFQKLFFYRVLFLLICLLGFYLMYDYSQGLFHPARYSSMNDGRMIDMRHSLFVVYLFVSVGAFIKLLTCSFKLFVVGDKGVMLYRYKSTKHYTMKKQLFNDKDFDIKKWVEYDEDKEHKEAVEQMYSYFNVRRN
ncbi:hypothetical protein [Sulfurimonas sp.]